MVASGCHSSGNKGDASADPMQNRPAEVRELEYVAQELPAGLPRPSEDQGGLRWQDGQGEFVLVLGLERAVEPASEETPMEHETVKLSAVCYPIMPGGEPSRELWTWMNELAPCPLDLTALFEPAATLLTDLDQDGVAEVSFLTRTACRADLSPAKLEIHLHEGDQAYVLEGTTGISYEGQSEEAQVTREPEGPEAFREHLLGLFEEFKMEEF